MSATGTPAFRVPLGVRSLSLTLVGVGAAILLLHYLQEVFIPMVLSALLFYALDPFVDRLEQSMHRAAAAAGVLLLVVAVVGAAAFNLRDEAVAVIDKVPTAAQRLRTVLTEQRASGEPTPIEKVQRAATEIEQTAVEATEPGPAPQGVMRVQIEEPPLDVSRYVWWGSLGILGFSADLVMILFLTYFLLVSDDLYKRKLMKMMPSMSKKKITLQIVNDIGHQIERFLLVQIFTSLVVAVVTTAAMWWIGLEQAAIWGVLAGVFNSVPYFGPVLVTAVLTLVAFVQFGTIEMALLASGLALLITTLEGWLLTPALMGRAARMSPAAIFIGLIFWSWIWGVWGLLLAVPMMMCAKAICDHVEDLQWVAELLSD